MSSIRITKLMANDAAMKIAEKASLGTIKEIKQQLSDKATELAKKYIPSPVLACAKEYGSFLGTHENVVIRKMVTDSDGTERAVGYIHSTTSIPIPHSCCYIMVNSDDFNEIDKIEKNLKSAMERERKLCEEVCHTLIALRTLKNVETEFPEALKYIDVPAEKCLPVPLLSDLRKIVGKIS